MVRGGHASAVDRAADCIARMGLRHVRGPSLRIEHERGNAGPPASAPSELTLCSLAGGTGVSGSVGVGARWSFAAAQAAAKGAAASARWWPWVRQSSAGRSRSATIGWKAHPTANAERSKTHRRTRAPDPGRPRWQEGADAARVFDRRIPPDPGSGQPGCPHRFAVAGRQPQWCEPRPGMRELLRASGPRPAAACPQLRASCWKCAISATWL